MANYYWENQSIATITRGSQFINPAFLFIYGISGSSTVYSHPSYDMTFSYLTNFHSAAPTQPTLRFVNSGYNNLNTSIFPTTICPDGNDSTFSSGPVSDTVVTLTPGVNRMYIILKSGGGGGGGGGGGTNTSSCWGGGGGGGGGGGMMGKMIPVVAGQNTYTYAVGGGGAGGTGGRNPANGATNTAGNIGTPGGLTKFTYNGITHQCNGGLAGGGGGLGFTPPITKGSAGLSGSGGTCSPAITTPAIETLVNGGVGTAGEDGSLAPNSLGGAGGTDSGFPFIVNSPTSFYVAASLYGNAGSGGNGFRGPTLYSNFGNAGGSGMIHVFPYYD